MPNTKSKSYLFYLLLPFVLFIFACTEQTPVSGGESSSSEEVALENPEITVEFTGEVLEIINEEVNQQNNCGGNAEVTSEVFRSLTIVHEMDVSGEVEVRADGTVSIAGTGIGLGAKVASELGYTYGSRETIGRSISVKASPKTSMEHQIQIAEIWKTGNAIVVVNNEKHQISFRFREGFSINLVNSVNLGCPTLTPELSTTSASTEPTVTSTRMETPTVTFSPTPSPTPTSTTGSNLILEGAIEEIERPPSVDPNQYEDNRAIVIFEEVSHFTLGNALIVDISEPGAYNSRGDLTQDRIPEGTTIDSYFIHFDPIGENNDVTLKGTITFESRIIGIILLAQQLNDSDLIIAAGLDTVYPTGGVNRRFELSKTKKEH